MLDSGSDRDIIATELAAELGLKSTTKTVNVKTVETNSTTKKQFTNLRIEAIDESYGADISDAMIARLLTNGNDIPPAKRDKSQFPQANGISFEDHDAGIQMILGVAHAETWIGAEVRRGGAGKPHLIKTQFGWTAVGGWKRDDIANISCYATQVDDASLRSDFRRIFDHDFATVSEAEVGDSVENKEAVRQLNETITFDEGVEKYRVGLPWKYGRAHAIQTLNALDSEQMAFRRLKGMIPRFLRDPERKSRVFAEMRKFEELGYAEVLDQEERDTTNGPRWYLPIHVVEKNAKTRICHDARANVRGVCLNDLLLGSPNLLNSLPGILLSFRTKKIAFMMDIQKFFHQVLVDERDQDAFRYLWFEDESMSSTKTLRFKAHIFGSGASSLVTSFVLRYHAEKIKDDYPNNVYETIRDQIYVDDGSGGADSIDEALELKRNLKEALARGGFNLAKWKSNAPELLVGEETSSTADKNDQSEEPTKVLGVEWQTERDLFTFHFNAIAELGEVETPRGLTSLQAMLFDPSGFLSPFMLLARRMLQRSMVGKVSWDSLLDEKLKKEFDKWVASIPLLAELEIPRWWNTPETEDEASEQIHLFSDASISGYAAVGYRRVTGASGATHVTIISARSHVVPLNPEKTSHHNSVPRLELAAAVKAVEIRQFIQKTLKRQIQTFMWTDSECVLKQLFDRSTSYRAYVANRLSKIHAATKVSEWRYVDSKRNPADHASRGIQAHEKEKWRVFHQGPDFLRLPEEHWPVTNVPTRTEAVSPEDLVNAAATAVQQQKNTWLMIIDKVEKWHQKVKRVIAMKKIIKFWRWKSTHRHNTRSRSAMAEIEWNASQPEIADAERTIFAAIQDCAFSAEKEALREAGVDGPDCRRQMKTKTSKLLAHNPFIATDGLIRIGSRLVNASIKEEAKFPVILPRNDPSTTSLIRATHVNLIHAGPKLLLTELRQRVWILQGLQEVKKVVSACIVCQKAFKKPLEQRMAPLPEFRVTSGHAWEETGLDYAGPISARVSGRASQKVWIALFTCMRTRAVHLELVFNLDAASTINAIVRFCSRRPGVRTFVSDRGTNMTSADKILKKQLEAFNSEVAPQLLQRGLSWRFIPAGTPHYGGSWERMVALVKKHLQLVLEKTVLHVDVLNTAIVEIEGIVNRRPLTAISSSSSDHEAITPAHILYPDAVSHSSALMVENASEDDAERMRCSWRRAQARVNAFWKVWKREYLMLLHDRRKWRTTKKDIAVGDLVLLVDETCRRSEWKLGRVISVSGTPNHVRKAEVRRVDGRVLTKDRTKLVLLELDV